MIAAPEVEHFERAIDRHAFPLRVAEMGVANTELFEGGEAEEGREAELMAEERVIGDIFVSFHDGDERPCTDEVGGMKCRAGDTVEREVAEIGDRGGNRDNEPLAPVRCAVR